jgi:hypothetical protein
MLLLFAWVLSVGGSICMLFAWVLRWYLLKPMQILTHPYTRLLKPMQIAAKKKPRGNVAAICMGFKRWWQYLHAICIGFNVVPLKTHANTDTSLHKALKTHANSSKRKPRDLNKSSKVLKTHAYSSKSCSQSSPEPEHTFLLQGLALRKPPSRTHAASPRPHARTNRNRKSKSISRLRGVGQAGLAPPNLRYIYMI